MIGRSVVFLQAGFFISAPSVSIGMSASIDLSVIHVPVMVDEIVEGLQLKAGGIWVDCTVGDGGHSRTILEKTSPGGYLIGFDKDNQALRVAKQALQDIEGRVELVQGSYAGMLQPLSQARTGLVDGILFDLGISSRQVDESGYGLSFNRSETLDMRFDKSQDLMAMDVINEYDFEDLSRIFKEYGEERYSKRIARKIIDSRPLSTTDELADLVTTCVRKDASGRHPATRVFQALRIEVNQELEDLHAGLESALTALKVQGRMAVISYHSLEDRIVKNFMRDKSKACQCPKAIPVCVCEVLQRLRLVNRKVIKPSVKEVDRNRRSRSARLRVAEKIG